MEETKFARWQGRTIEQMGYVINTLLVLAIATLGFVISKLIDNNIYCCAKYLLIVGCIILLICVLLLLLAIINRLMDFRITTQNAKHSDDKEDTQKIGERTWSLFYAGIATFMLGQLFIVIGFAIHIL